MAYVSKIRDANGNWIDIAGAGPVGPSGPPGPASTVPGPPGPVGATPHPYAIYKQGYYYDNHFGGAGYSVYALYAQNLYLMPIWVGRPMTLDRIGFTVATAVAASTARIGIYTVDSNFLAQRYFESAIIDTSTTGTKEAVVSHLVETPGYIYIGIWVSHGISTYGAPITALAVGSSTPPWTAAQPFFMTGYTTAQAAVGLPGPFTTTPGGAGASTTPIVWYRAGA